MEQNDQAIKASILELFKDLTNSYVENSDLITNQLMEIYSQQEINIIPILFDIFSNHQNETFRKQASIGLRICIRKSFQLLDEDSIQQIWNAFFQVFTSEPNDELIQFIIMPAIDLFSLSKKAYNVGFENFGFLNFFQSLEEVNFIRCLQILTQFLAESIKFEKNFYDFVLHMLQLSYEYTEKYEIIPEITFISYILISREQIEDDVKNEISIQLSQLFVELLSDIDDFKLRLLSQFVKILSLDIQPLKMEIIFGPIFQLLVDQNISIKYKYRIAYLFSMVFSLDETKFDQNDIIQLFKISIYISVMIFDDSEDPSDPESIVMDGLISECLKRLPDKKVQNIFITTFQCLIGQSDEFDFGTSSLYSKLFTALILIDSAIQQSIFLFFDLIPKIAEFCVSCFEANQPAVQDYASCLFKEHISIFKDHIRPQIQEISSSVIAKIDSNDFYSGFDILSEILGNFPTDVCDQLFLPIYTLCSQKVELPVDSPINQSMVFHSWFLLANLFRNISSEVASNYFDEIFPISIEIINGFYGSQTQRQEQNYSLSEETDIPSIVIELIGSFSVSCSEKLESQFENVTSLLLELFQFQYQNYLNQLTNDLMICKSVLNCLRFFADEMTKSISPFVDTFLPTVIENLNSKMAESAADDFDTYEMIKNKLDYLSNSIIVPSIELIGEIVEKLPEKIHSQEVIGDICVIPIRYLESNLKSEVLSSINLIVQIINFFCTLSQNSENQDDSSYLEMTKTFIPIIYQKFYFEVENSVPNEDYDAFYAWLECIGNVYMRFKINAFEIEDKDQKRYIIFDIFDTLLDIAGSTNIKVDDEEEEENEGGRKLRFIRGLHDNIENFLIIIIKYFQQEDFSVFAQFIPKILQFFDEKNLYFHAFSINILAYLIHESSIIEKDLICQLFERSVKSITDEDPHISRYFVFFISNLRFNYSELLIENHDNLIQIIDNVISNLDTSKSEYRCLVEYLLALFAILDFCLGESIEITDSQRFEWFISKLPIQFSQSDNNEIIFQYLIQNFDKFPELRNNVFALFCHVFISTSSIGYSYLKKEAINLLFQIILKSNICENQEAILAIFDGDENLAKSFYETIHSLIELQNQQD